MKNLKTFEQFINESENKLNEELYDLVKDLKSALRKGNSVKDVIDYLGRRLSKAEYAALQQAGVMTGKYKK